MRGTRGLAAVWEALASLKLAIACLVLLMVLVVACTLAQVSLGTYGAVKATMRTFWVYAPLGGVNLPVFPGGGLVGLLLLLNLSAAQLGRLEWSARKAGIWAVHLGLILLFLGEFVTGFFQVETQMAIPEGSTLNYSESPRDLELAIVDATAKDYDEVYGVSERVLERGGEVRDPRLPFALRVERYARHAAEGGEAVAWVWLEAGTFSLSSADPVPQAFEFKGRSYRLALRPVRHYLPYSLTLEKFKREVYPGTDIPSHFSSRVRLSNPASGEARNVLISMNNPLRYAGKAFYQASFDKNDTVSILQVVDNPGWVLPYLSCALVTLGLLLHFFQRLFGWRGVRAS